MLTELDDDQRSAVLNGDGYTMVNANSGAGKTRCLAARVCYLLDKGVDPSTIIVVTFTNKAAGEMIDRIALYSKKDVSGLWIGTIHSICSRLLRTYSDKADVPFDFNVYSEAEANTIFKEACSSIFKLRASSELQTEISRFKCSLKSINYWKHRLKCMNDLDPDIFETIYNRYQELLMQNSAMDFDDIINKTALLLRNKQHIWREISSKFSYILLDEAQDCSKPEWSILEKLAKINGNFFCVGDERQAIYCWRGSDPGGMRKFLKRHSDCNVFNLLRNYRSCTEIVDATNAIFSGDKHLKPAIPVVKEKGLIKVLCFENDQHEAQAIARFIKAGFAEGILYSDVAILFRTKNIMQTIAMTFIEAEIPFTNDDFKEHDIGRVSLLTIHAAKSLEFPIVFIPACEEGQLPHYRSSHSNSVLKEERRLFYVACTRASRILVLTHAKQRQRFSNQQFTQSPSRFLNLLAL